MSVFGFPRLTSALANSGQGWFVGLALFAGLANHSFWAFACLESLLGRQIGVVPSDHAAGSGVAFDPWRRQGQQQAPAPQLLAEFGGQGPFAPPIPLPGPTQITENQQQSQADRETENHLQAELEHGATPIASSRGGR